MLPRIRQWLIPHGKDAKDHSGNGRGNNSDGSKNNDENGSNEHKKDQNSHEQQQHQAKLLAQANTPKPESGNYHGLVNFGNTCYCNSVIQVRYSNRTYRL